MQTARVRLSLRLLMIVIAVIGLAVFAVRQMFFANTIYSVGYDELRFRQVRVGMTSSQVEALMGPPLEKVPWPEESGGVIWFYTDRRHNRSGDYWKRDVWMKDDKVSNVINMYWQD
jgi:outer membrane protein assembly factor BamE (lipoprotein component of BamABCDE complex)